jgi:hypothetical protein
MLKNIFIAVLFLFSVSSLAQDEFDPGFGDEGGGDAADAPGAPIDNIVLPLLVTGILTTIYFVRKKERHLKQI